MAEYINREILIKRLEHEADLSSDIINLLILNGIANIVRDKNIAPAADVVEVVYGEWEEAWEGAYRCSICHHAPMVNINDRWLFTKYCPNCGAKMDGENNE